MRFYFAEEVMLAEENKNSGPSALDGKMFALCCFYFSFSHVDCGMQFFNYVSGLGSCDNFEHTSKYAFSLCPRFYHLFNSLFYHIKPVLVP